MAHIVLIARRQPNTGKTNPIFTLVDVADRTGNVIEKVPDDFLVLSNAESWTRADIEEDLTHFDV